MKRNKRETKMVHLQDFDRNEAMMESDCSIDHDECTIDVRPLLDTHKSVPDDEAHTGPRSFSWLRSCSPTPSC